MFDFMRFYTVPVLLTCTYLNKWLNKQIKFCPGSSGDDYFLALRERGIAIIKCIFSEVGCDGCV